METNGAVARAGMNDPHWPSPVEILNAHGTSAMVLFCEHASNYIPPEYAGLGLSVAQLQRHIAWDIGAAGVVRQLSQLLDAPAFLGCYSRLLIDLNRTPRAPSSIVTRSEATEIPGNIGITAAERERRLARIFNPYHRAIEAHLAERAQSNRPTVIVAVHSFTPTYHGVARQWHAGVVFEKSADFGYSTVERLRAGDGSAHIGVNEPYGVTPGDEYGFLIYGDHIGNPAILIEIRQDLLLQPLEQAGWAHRLANALALDVALADSLRRPSSKIT